MISAQPHLEVASSRYENKAKSKAKHKAKDESEDKATAKLRNSAEAAQILHYLRERPAATII